MSAATVTPTLLVTVAHPDDESFGCGSVIAGYAARGWRVVVCSATRGEAGEDESGRDLHGDDLGAAREAEIRASSAILGAADVVLLNFADCGWDGEAPPESLVARTDELTATVGEILRTYRPDVVVTMDPTGSDGHRDHAAIGSATTAAVTDVADWPMSLYHWCLPHSLMDAWSREIAQADPDSVYVGTALGRADDDVTTIIDGSELLDVRSRSMAEHRTQAGPYRAVSAGLATEFLRRDHLVRIIPPWTGGPLETDLHLPGRGRSPHTAHAVGAPEYHAACASFNVAATPTPTFAVAASTVPDIQSAVRFAAQHGLTVTPHATGQGAVHTVDDGLLINTSALDSVHIDPEKRTATVGAGTRWRQVIDAAAPYGLAPLNGSSSDVGVVGYSLGGGMGPMARTFGFAADRIHSLRMVDADGALRDIDPDHAPDCSGRCAAANGHPASSPR